ncbi:hypothetical protein EB118_06830 [bacterium]|nr:hypothetical protein [bacterium]NDC95253.1 hypothetical protein [bacterium]NDD85000.1 hypothetical protein [bacterium]NDG29794.1 hypothetical protein [bacterium]
MESLALAVVVIFLVVIFFGSFTGFILGDNVTNKLVIGLFAILPAAAIAALFPIPLLGLLWISSLAFGYVIGWILR